jgi:hypothetical protein
MVRVSLGRELLFFCGQSSPDRAKDCNPRPRLDPGSLCVSTGAGFHGGELGSRWQSCRKSAQPHHERQNTPEEPGSAERRGGPVHF